MEADTLLGLAMTAENEEIANAVHEVDRACLKLEGSLRQSAEQSGIESIDLMERIHGMKVLGRLEEKSHGSPDPTALVLAWE